MNTLTPSPIVKLAAVCHDCRTRHEYACHASELLIKQGEWQEKHIGHRIEFHSPERQMLTGHKPSAFRRMMRWFDKAYEETQIAPWWLDYAPNADLKLTYAVSASYAMAVEALSSDVNLLSGRQSGAVDNRTNLYLDYLVGGKVTVGTTPTADRSIQIYAYGSVNDVPDYLDVITGINSTVVLTNGDIRNAGLNYVAQSSVRATTDVSYWFKPVALSTVFSGIIPKFHGLFVTHDTGVALNNLGANQQMDYTGTYVTSA